MSNTGQASGHPPCVFTIDVEDWFHILDAPSVPPVAAWPDLTSRVQPNLLRLLDILEQHKVRATCFFLGWVARRCPDAVRRAVAAGHEVASHGMFHRMPSLLSDAEMVVETGDSKKVIEDIAGAEVLGFRAAGFSLPRPAEPFFDTLARAGYAYDASVFPARHGHGGWPGARLEPHIIHTPSGPLHEFPATMATYAGRRICMFGGGYLRLFPHRLIRSAARRVLRAGRPVVFYVHPREIDPRHPRLSLPPYRRFKSYVNLDSTQPKITRLLSEFDFVTMRDLLPAPIPVGPGPS